MPQDYKIKKNGGAEWSAVLNADIQNIHCSFQI
jgi:hypothetical protein